MQTFINNACDDQATDKISTEIRTEILHDIHSRMENQMSAAARSLADQLATTQKSQIDRHDAFCSSLNDINDRCSALVDENVVL